jgi:hypothetical protein
MKRDVVCPQELLTTLMALMTRNKGCLRINTVQGLELRDEVFSGPHHMKTCSPGLWPNISSKPGYFGCASPCHINSPKSRSQGVTSTGVVTEHCGHHMCDGDTALRQSPRDSVSQSSFALPIPSASLQVCTSKETPHQICKQICFSQRCYTLTLEIGQRLQRCLS